METTGDTRISERGEGSRQAARKQIRGSSLLLGGKLVSVGVNFISQVLVVRYLSTTDYGAWAYALAFVAFCQGFSTLGLDRAITRFVPIYHEKQEYAKFFGTILLVISSILLTSLFVIIAFYSFPDELARLINDKEQPLTLLFVMIFLVPVEALDGLLIGLFAGFSNARAIFFRRYVLGPGLKLSVVLLLIGLKSRVTFLAYGYLAASLLGVLIYSWELIRLLRKEGLFEKLQQLRVQVPAREVFAFTIPLMTSDLVTILMHSANILLLGYFCDLNQVALFRVALPAAALNRLVMQSFGLLYTPTAARLFAKEDHRGINDLYWKTAVWMAVLSFPIFALTFSLAQPLTVFLYGARYEKSWVILALLSLGYYFNVSLGFNGLTLKVLGKLRYIVIINILAAVTNVVANLMLIPRYGALGAAIGTAGTMIAHNIFKQAGLRFATGVSLFDKKCFPFYLMITTCAFGLLMVQFVSSGSIYFLLPLAALASLIVFAFGKKKLNVAETFPELVRLPLVRTIFA